MKNNKKADTIAGIIIAIFILSFILLGIINILDYNRETLHDYGNKTDLYILKSNAENLIKKIDTSNIEENETFYIYKEKTVNNNYTIFTGSTNESYKYIDSYGNNINPDNFEGQVYIREFKKKTDLIRNNLSPSEINNLVFHFDANNIDGSNNTSLNNGDSIDIWTDLNGTQNAVKKGTFSQNSSYSSDSPTYKEIGINGLPMVNFNGSNQMLTMEQHEDINKDDDNPCYSNMTFNEKSFALVFKTGMNIQNDQIIYEQGGNAIGYNFMIENGNLYAGVHNKIGYLGTTATCLSFSPTDSTYHFQWDTDNHFKSVNLGSVLPDTTYFIMIVQDSNNFDTNGDHIDSQNKLKIYLNGYLADEIDHVDPVSEHYSGGIGNVFLRNIKPTSPYTLINDVTLSHDAYFEGGIGELISWNHALSEYEIRGVQNYFNQKWLGGENNVKYDVINTIIEEYKNY